MCLILFAWQHHPAFPLVLAANRDEYYARPTRASGWWQQPADLLAGRDLQSGGTWMGIRANGRFAAVTNIRAPRFRQPAQHSRGQLVLDCLRNESPGHATGSRSDAWQPANPWASYGGFNLLYGVLPRHLFIHASGQTVALPVPAGVHGLSNASLDTGWPKVAMGRKRLRRLLEGKTVNLEALLELLADTQPFADAELPDTGVGLELERQLSPLMIRMAEYGTRSSTALILHHDGRLEWLERSFNHGPRSEDRHFELRLRFC